MAHENDVNLPDPLLVDQYERMKPLFAEAAEQLRRVIVGALGKISDRLLVRGSLEPIRIKELTSLARKAERNGWSADSAISHASDMIGARIVCPNLNDVYRIAELLKESLVFDDPPPEAQDYIKTPKASGYRALHLNVRLDVGHPFPTYRFGCEIQVRTMLQHVWSELTHADLYKKGETLPTDLRERATDLATQLAAADQIAQRIRDRVSEERIPAELRPNLRRLSADGIAYLFATTFGRNPAEYIVRETLESSRQLGLASLEPLAGVLQDPEVRSEVEHAYRQVAGWPPSPEDVFLVLPAAAAQGIKVAKKAARRAAREARAEIDRMATSEMLLELPADFESFLDELRSEEIDIAALARMFGTTTNCLVCSAEIVQADALDAAISDHYGVEPDGQVESIIWNSGVEVGHFDHPHLCAYHGDQADKND